MPAAGDGDTNRGAGRKREHGASGDRLHSAIEPERPESGPDPTRPRARDCRRVDPRPGLAAQPRRVERVAYLGPHLEEIAKIGRRGECCEIAVER